MLGVIDLETNLLLGFIKGCIYYLSKLNNLNQMDFLALHIHEQSKTIQKKNVNRYIVMSICTK
jgi:hypothetical protein